MPRHGSLHEGLLGSGNDGTELRTSTERRLQVFDEQLARQSVVSGEALVRTPSAEEDLEAAVAADPSTPAVDVRRRVLGRVARAQRARTQLRQLDADIQELRSQVQRAAMLRGPSGARHTCDANSTVGGCNKVFAAEDGVVCTGCDLFLCEPCFGSAVVKNECPGEGRYMKDLDGSPPGSLPCPLFPQECNCGHIPLPAIQRALLHTANRGVDGDAEDIESPGVSPHKLHLLARRRWAEMQTSDAAGSKEMLLRTVTHVRRQTFALARTQSGAHAALADKLNEIKQLKVELAMSPPSSAILTDERRVCARCRLTFAYWEGGQCASAQPSHFLCAVCFGGYIMRACAEGSYFEREIQSSTGIVISAAGCLPCAFWEGHTKAQLAPHANVSSAEQSRSARLLQLSVEAKPEGESGPGYGPPRQLAVSATDLEGLCLGLSRELGVQVVLLLNLDDDFHEWCVPTSLDDLADQAKIRVRTSRRPFAEEHEAEPEPEPDQSADAVGVSRPASPGATVPGSWISPTMNCTCGSIPMSVIEQVMLDPRNSSANFWRERHADIVIDSHSDATITVGSRRHNLLSNEGADLPDDWVSADCLVYLIRPHFRRVCLMRAHMQVMETDHMSNQPIFFNTVTVRLQFTAQH